jgi:hypothetical protein
MFIATIATNHVLKDTIKDMYVNQKTSEVLKVGNHNEHRQLFVKLWILSKGTLSRIMCSSRVDLQILFEVLSVNKTFNEL